MLGLVVNTDRELWGVRRDDLRGAEQRVRFGAFDIHFDKRRPTVAQNFVESAHLNFGVTFVGNL
jgi:hypothetical protein